MYIAAPVLLGNPICSYFEANAECKCTSNPHFSTGESLHAVGAVVNQVTKWLLVVNLVNQFQSQLLA